MVSVAPARYHDNIDGMPEFHPIGWRIAGKWTGSALDLLSSRYWSFRSPKLEGQSLAENLSGPPGQHDLQKFVATKE